MKRSFVSIGSVIFIKRNFPEFWFYSVAETLFYIYFLLDLFSNCDYICIKKKKTREPPNFFFFFFYSWVSSETGGGGGSGSSDGGGGGGAIP